MTHTLAYVCHSIPGHNYLNLFPLNTACTSVEVLHGASCSPSVYAHEALNHHCVNCEYWIQEQPYDIPYNPIIFTKARFWNTNNSTMCGDEEDTPELPGCLNRKEVRKSQLLLSNTQYTVILHIPCHKEHNMNRAGRPSMYMGALTSDKINSYSIQLHIYVYTSGRHIRNTPVRCKLHKTHLLTQ